MDLSVYDTALEVKLTLPCLNVFKEISHQKNVNLCLVFHVHGENSIDSSDQTVLILDKICEVAGETFEHDLLLTSVHCLDDESLVIGLEHETTGLSL